MADLITYDALIIGGGLAGLTCALHLSQANCKVLLVEKHTYPHHKVCGEYVSNEVLQYLKNLGIDPYAKGAKKISKFEMSSKNGAVIQTELPLGGFGISRYSFDNILYEELRKHAEVVFDTVSSVSFSSEIFTVETQNKNRYKAHYVVGAFGKRSNIDINLKRDFIRERSSWLAVKAHYECDFPEDTVALHNFEGGYCGLSKTETNAVNACYLTTYKSFKRVGAIGAFQEQVLSENPYLKDFFSTARLLFDKPLTISQISFQKKEPVTNHIFMIGDSAGLIHPLCGNGMAMAIHAAKLFSELFLSAYKTGHADRSQLEQLYTDIWQKTFSKRLRTGRRIQNMLLRPAATSIGFRIAKVVPALVPNLIKHTHGNVL